MRAGNFAAFKQSNMQNDSLVIPKDCNTSNLGTAPSFFFPTGQEGISFLTLNSKSL